MADTYALITHVRHPPPTHHPPAHNAAFQHCSHHASPPHRAPCPPRSRGARSSPFVPQLRNSETKNTEHRIQKLFVCLSTTSVSSFLGVFSKRRNHATDERRTRPGHRTVSVRLSSSRKLSGFKNQKRFECFYLHKEYIVQREQARPRAVECSTHLTSHRRRNHMHYLARLLPLSQPRAAASQPTRHRIAHASSARSRGEDGSGWATPSTPAPCFFFFFLRCSLCTWPFHEACRTWAACNSTSVPV